MRKYMKNAGILFIMAVLITMTFAGCGGEEPKVWDNFTESLGKSLVEEVSFDEELQPIEMNLIGTMYGVDETDLKDYGVYMASGGTADEIAIFLATDEEKALKYADAVKARVEDQKAIMKDYLPEEVGKLDNAVIQTEGPYVVLCVSGDPETAKEVIDGYFSK